MPQIKIPVYEPTLGGREAEYVMDCLASNWISARGKYISEFERRFAEFTGVRHAVSVCNGTVALHAALLALGIGPGDEVIVPTLTYIATANAAVYCGATPVFADSTPGTWQLDPAGVARKIGPRTRAVIAVHLYGHPCDMDALARLCRARGLKLVEDCAEAIGTRIGGRHAGGFGDIATYSFYGNKTITTGEGGMIVTDDAHLRDRVAKLKGQGLAAGREYWHDEIGYNYRMTNICAAIGLAQLEQVETFLAQKRRIAERYLDAFRDLPVVFHGESPNTTHSYWMCSILLSDGDTRARLRTHLDARGIETRPVFSPLHTMPMYERSGESHPVADNLAARGLNLPSAPSLLGGNPPRIESVIAAVRGFYRG